MRKTLEERAKFIDETEFCAILHWTTIFTRFSQTIRAKNFKKITDEKVCHLTSILGKVKPFQSAKFRACYRRSRPPTSRENVTRLPY